MKYSPDTIRAVRDYSLAQGTSYAIGEIEDILCALGSTEEQKALRADAESHRMRMTHCVCQEGLCHYCRTGEARES